jgi:hypothetical protein
MLDKPYPLEYISIKEGVNWVKTGFGCRKDHSSGRGFFGKEETE